MRAFIPILLIAASVLTCQSQSRMLVGGGCDGCEIMFDGIPKTINEIDTTVAWKSTRRMAISGTIYQSNGKTPAAGTIVYYYHTNRNGLYAPAKGQIDGRQHGELRGWVKANQNGNYKIYTCIPGTYPNEKIPAHVHMVVKEPDINEYFIDDIHFDDDPLLTTSIRKKNENRGGSGVVMMEEKNGVTYVERNITLGLHIPDYPFQNPGETASGLSVGENCPAFDPIHFSGADKGKHLCPMCCYGADQGVIIWWNDKNISTLIELLKNFDGLIEKYGLKKLRVFVVYMNPEQKSLKAMTKDMTILAEKNNIKKCALLYIDSPQCQETFRQYQINKKVKNTIMIYRKRKIIDKFVNIENSNPTVLLNRLVL